MSDLVFFLQTITITTPFHYNYYSVIYMWLHVDMYNEIADYKIALRRRIVILSRVLRA